MRKLAYLLSLVMVFTIPWEDAITVGTIGTLTRAIGLLVAGVWLASTLVTKKIRRLHPFHVVAYLFIIWNITSLFWSVGEPETITHIKTYAQLGLLAWILWDLYVTPEVLRAALQAYILGAYVAIGSTIYNYLKGQEISTYAGGRYSGANLNAVDLALILVLGLPLAWHLVISAAGGTRGNVQKIFNLAYLPLALFAVLLTATRTAIFAIIPVAIYIAITIPRLKPFLRILFPIASIGVLFFLQANSPTASLDRLATTWGSIAAGDLGGRVPLWNTTLAIFAEHPILGIGAGDLHASTVLGAVAHNTYLSILAELGLIGFILFVILVGIVFIQALIQARRADILWMALLATWAIGVFTLSWEFRKPTWLLLSLVVVSANLFAPKYRFFVVSNVSSGPEVAKESTGEIKHEDLSSERYAPLPDPG